MEGYWYLQHTVSVTMAVLMLLVSSPDSVQAQCKTFYLEEPPPELFCNPHRFGELHLVCTMVVDSPCPVSVDLSIEWYHVPSGQSEAQLISRSDFRPHWIIQEGFSSEILIRNVAEGSYYCQPVIAGRGPLLPSQSTRIDPFYSQTFPCDVLAAPSSRCAEEGVASQNAPPLHFIYPITLMEFANLDTELAPTSPPALIPGCPYQYVEEPPLDPPCNPYPANAIRLSCALLIDVSRVPGQILRINLLYQSSDDAVPIVLQSSLKPFDVGIGLATVKTSFTVMVSNRPEGTYHCQPFLQGNTAILPSKHLMVRPAGSYDSLPPCNGETVSVPSMRCAMKLNSPMIDGTGEGIITHNATQNFTPEVTQGATPDGPPNSTFDNSTSGLPVWVYAIAAVGTVILVCVAITVTISVTLCYRKKHKATARAANRIEQTLPGESTSIYSISPLVTRCQSKAPSTRSSNSQDQYHYYSRPQWPTLRDDKSSTASYKGQDPTKGEEEDMNHENNGPYTFPARSIQRAEGDACNKGQKDCKSPPARPKPPVGAYQGLNVETMDYTSLYSRGVAPFSSHAYRALESSTMEPPIPYTRPIRQ